MEVYMKALFMIFLIMLLVFCACDLPNSGSYSNFWATNFITNSNYKLNAELLVEGQYCNVWVEVRSGVGEEEAQKIADEFDNNIYPKLLAAFGIDNIVYNEMPFGNIMDFADWLGNKDGKLCILLLNIKANNGLVGGYFFANDFFDSANSNKRDMLYVNTNLVKQNINQAYKLIVHEMQHLMNFATSVLVRYEIIGERQYINPMDIWIDEGLSTAAEYIYSGMYNNEYLEWFNHTGTNNSRNGLISKGNNFFTWGNRGSENLYAIMDDYATVYLFFQWLRLHAGDDIYKQIISSADIDHQSVTIPLDIALPGQGFSNWDTVLKTWLAANYINAPDGIYGYLDVPELAVKVPAPNSISATFLLAPGEGVYSLIGDSFSMPNLGTNIRYASLSSSAPLVSDTLTTAGRVLLTYNRNTSQNGAVESGTTTGFPIPAASATATVAHSLKPEALSHYWIGAGDIYREMRKDQYVLP